jgi:cytochrome c-type biogenesis protein CcmH/NrfG
VNWKAHAEGTGTRTLHWDASDRPQIAFAMHADASRPVRVRVESSEVTLDRMPWWVPAAALVLGMIVLLPAAVMLGRLMWPRRA